MLSPLFRPPYEGFDAESVSLAPGACILAETFADDPLMTYIRQRSAAAKASPLFRDLRTAAFYSTKGAGPAGKPMGL
ncbi:hypothetical protein AB4305_07250 [Nocardia sp. 2YAB30]|uniref:hypothetical protein n=1 Tax=unclassified Nocardia TaxID=2637762 RepID=UPI003F9B14D3